jgi:cytochrome c
VTRCIATAALLAVVACSRDQELEPQRRYELGRAATAAEIAALDTDVAPDGVGLPPGSGTVAEGRTIYVQQCALCHGENGEGVPPLNPPIIGRPPNAENFPFGNNPTLPRTIGNYWPYATTVFDYVRRAMPLPTPGSLSDDEVYAVTAYLLAANQVIPMTATLDSASLVAVKMPYMERFVPDDRRGAREVR